MLTHRAIRWCKDMLMKGRNDELMKYWADETLIIGNDELT